MEKQDTLFAYEESATAMDLSERSETKHGKEDGGCEMTAAAALTSLSASPRMDAEEEDDDDDDDDHDHFTIPQRYTRSGRKRAVSFPLKLMKVLSMKEFHDVITWMPSGRSFNIIDSKRFVAEILPDHFKSAKYSSFTRKLHRWGFIRHYRGEESGAFFHKNFQKGRFDLVEKMTCYKQDPPKATVPLASPTTSLRPPTKQPCPSTRPAPLSNSPPSLPTLMSQPTPVRALPSVSLVEQSNSLDVDLNTAIELEVARRVRERLDVAALNRQLALIQEQQLIQQQQEQQLIKQQQEQQLKQALAAQSVLANQGQLPWTQQGISMLKRSMMPLCQNGNNYKPMSLPFIYNTNGSESQPFKAMPQTNIFGAKTA